MISLLLATLFVFMIFTVIIVFPIVGIVLGRAVSVILGLIPAAFSFGGMILLVWVYMMLTR